ncbi:MAG: (d)CMP kinase [Chloroflexota bacterium]
MQIAIDGPAGAGKSTLARNLASVLDCPYVDTGLMYRAVTLYAVSHSVPLDDGQALARIAADFSFRLGQAGEMVIDGERPSPQLHSAPVNTHVSEVSAHPEVREILVQRQRSLANEHCVVMAGRDIGTTVLPAAQVKIWVTAASQIRARRRSQQTGQRESVPRLESRDERDTERLTSPLRRPPDAVSIETDRLTPAQSLEAALQITGQALGAGR